MRQNFKIFVILICELISIILLPLAISYRFFFVRSHNLKVRSIWTGAPIIILPLLAKAERALGFNSITIVKTTFYITDAFDVVLQKKLKSKLLADFGMYAVFLWACATANRVHAFVDQGILPVHHRFRFNQLELFCYKLLGIKLFIWAYGADVRTRARTESLGASNCCTDCTQIRVACICDNQMAEANYNSVKKAATAIFSMGDMIEYTEGSINELYYWPVDLAKEQGEYYKPSYPLLNKSNHIKIVHAPNHREFKGTRYLEAAVSRLQREGIAIELVLVEKMSNKKAMEIYRTADIVFDQCLIGFHGYFALEAMALGKPVMCYIRKPKEYLLNFTDCPIINVNRHNLYNILKSYSIESQHNLYNLGLKSRQYIEMNYSLDVFTDRLRLCYQRLGVAI